MSYPTFDDLPFNKRPDLSPYLIHLTKNTKLKDDYSAYVNGGSKPGRRGGVKTSHWIVT